ncbi:MAG TPA: zinc ribbon domain-containing protein [Thermoleophilia bacterium]|nr:zinc ribbon domain-containing protein [Thermoleophilia bacterium]
MYCPECGFDAGEAKFCPECGTKLDQVREAVRGAGAAKGPRTTGSTRAGAARKGGDRTDDAVESAPRGGPRPAKSGTNPTYVWIGVAVVAIVAAVAMYMLTTHKGSGSSGTSSVAADTSGSYQQLVQRANAHYDQGSPYIQQGDFSAAQPYFVAAAKEYGAAWAQQANDPQVAGDYATSLFYVGDPNGALSMANKALKLRPTGQLLQTILFNKGNYLAMIGRQEVQSGKAKAGQAHLAQAGAAYRKAVAADPGSQTGKDAQSALAGLSKVTPAASPSASSVPVQ